MENRRSLGEGIHRRLIWLALAATMLFLAVPTGAIAEPGAQPSGNPVAQDAAPLIVEEWPLIDQQEGMPGDTEYMDLIDPAILGAHRSVRETRPGIQLETTNATLAKFGYGLVETEGQAGRVDLADLYRGDKRLLSNIDMVRLALSPDGTDIAMFAMDNRGKGSLVRKDTVVSWGYLEHALMPPVFVGKQLAWVDTNQAMDQYSVKLDGQEVYSFTTEPVMVAERVKSLTSYGTDWIIEVDGQLIVSGRNLNEEQGYDEAFGFRKVNGQPFYFYSQGGRVYVSYAGETLPYEYDSVFHYRCCAESAFNPRGNDRMTWFHALRDGVWHYVEMGNYE